MSGWAIVAVVAIVVWGMIRFVKTVKGDPRAVHDAAAHAAIEELRGAVERLAERTMVLERIVTDSNSPDARERARIAAEIEALRGGSQALPAATKEALEP